MLQIIRDQTDKICNLCFDYKTRHVNGRCQGKLRSSPMPSTPCRIQCTRRFVINKDIVIAEQLVLI